jgi:putative CocE/NonD family hydrolase
LEPPREEMVPMRDGVRLATDIYLPPGHDGAPLPVIAIRTPYGKQGFAGTEIESEAQMFARKGYAVAVQDVRGKWRSEGDYTVSASDPQDGYDCLTWLAAQPWSNGRIGTYGCSYLGENQLQLARLRHPNHLAMIPKAAGGAYRTFGLVWGGALELAQSFLWFRVHGSNDPTFVPPDVSEIDLAEWAPQLPVIDLVRRSGGPRTDYERLVSSSPTDPWWDTLGYVQEGDTFDVPALHVNSWYDYGAADTLAIYDICRDGSTTAGTRSGQFLIMSPMPHCQSESATTETFVGERAMGDASLDYYDTYVRWFDAWLKGDADRLAGIPRVQYFVMGRNEWRTSDSWPPPTRPVELFLRASRELSRENATSDEQPDTYVSDPANPVPTVGGVLGTTSSKSDKLEGAFDQRAVENREDVLVYSSHALADELEVTGNVRVVLHVSSTAPDTDFTAKLVDVYPDGRAFNVSEGILRARYRTGFARETFLTTGEVAELSIDLGATCNAFGVGHRVRLEVASSNFPRFDRNLQTGGRNYDEETWQIATNSIHHGVEHPSRLVLPVVVHPQRAAP